MIEFCIKRRDGVIFLVTVNTKTYEVTARPVGSMPSPLVVA